VPSGDSGINKPFDRILKSFAEEAPELFLRLLGFIPADAGADLQPLRPETAPTVVLPDYVAILQTETGERTIIHVEFQSKYHLDVPRDMARYGASLAWQHQIPVESVLMLLRPDGVPAEVPEVGHYHIGATRTTHPYKVVRLWEINPAAVLETNNPKLLPWALLMKSTDEQVRKIGSILGRQDDEEALGRFLTLGSLRYDSSSLNEMLGGGKMGIVRAILDGSSLVREEREQAAAEGIAEGMAKGQASEARKVLRFLLKKNFPGLEPIPAIDAITSVAILESLMEATFNETDTASMRAAILAAVNAQATEA
jgi:predicted transposase YdaD